MNAIDNLTRTDGCRVIIDVEMLTKGTNNSIIEDITGADDARDYGHGVYQVLLSRNGEVETPDGDLKYSSSSIPVSHKFYTLPDAEENGVTFEDGVKLTGLSVCLVEFTDFAQDALGIPRFGFGVTGGNFNVLWDVATAYTRLGYLPPTSIINRAAVNPSGGSDEDILVINAILREVDIIATQADCSRISCRMVLTHYMQAAKRKQAKAENKT